MAELFLVPAPIAPRNAPGSIPDAAERERALDITQSWIVEAPAGSGKTGLLIQRFLKLLAGADDPAQVLAITFTRKATHEMRDRVLGQLAQAQRAEPPLQPFDVVTRPLAQAALLRDRQLGWRLLDYPARLNIRTIDSFCTEIARSLPVLSGSAGAQSPVDDADDLYAEAARRTLSLLGGDDPALTSALELLLLHRDGNLADCQKLLSDMLGCRDQWGDLIPLSPDALNDTYLETVTLPKLNKALDLAICRTLTRLDHLMPPALGHELALLAHRMSQAAGYNGAESPLAICRELTSAPGRAAADLAHWRALAHLAIAPSSQDWRKPKGIQQQHLKFDIAPHEKPELVSILEDLSDVPGLCDALCALSNLPPVQYPPRQWDVAKALFRVLSRALVELQIVFAERGVCDFTEFSLLARSALRLDGAVEDLAASAGIHLEHLLVDEMQDTSSSQYELIRLLTQRWDGHSQTVFLVGDPRQSIYLFRQARVERFLDTLRTARLGDVPLTALYLTANFRSQANLVGAFNGTFVPIFPQPANDADPDAIPYREASAIRKRSPGPHLVWHAAPLAYSDDTEVCASQRRAQSRANAAAIRRIVEQGRARPLPADRKTRRNPQDGKVEKEPWKIAVLVASRTHLLEVVQAFRQQPSIPFRAVKTEPLGERQEVLDLFALTRALLHPADRTAWLALLRTPWCGLTTRDLHLLAGEDDPRWRQHTILDLMEQRGDLLSDDGLARLQPFWTVMKAALAQRGHLPLSQWVERTWNAFGADAFASEEEHANARQFLALLDKLEADPSGFTLPRLEEHLAKLYAAPSTAEDAVDLMTIHGAKGLEWDVVLIPALEKAGQTSRSRLLSWLEIGSGDDDDAAHGILAPVQPKGADALALNKWMRSIESAREAAERKRLLYVACTRAREELHLFAAPERKKSGEIGRRHGSLLAAAWPAAESHFADFPAAIPMPSPQPGLFDMAAAFEVSTPTRILQRIPRSAMHLGDPTPGLAAATSPRPYARPEGSFSRRAFGNVMHAFLEALADRIALGASPAALLAELPTWSRRIATVLRAGGLAPTEIDRAAANILRGLTRTLQSPQGQWLLAPHPEAASEKSIVSPQADAPLTLRLDRTFLAGPTPLSPGSGFLWIIDYKTADHGPEGLEAFLQQEREKYAEQLSTYARELAPQGRPIRLALFYPMLARLVPIEPLTLAAWEPNAASPPTPRRATPK